ncbi:MAG TPA: methyltransferase domain-containing protein [Pilimelia sp.]|nr:methyltransferase domain-containing protein [Pilimelia sp.]
MDADARWLAAMWGFVREHLPAAPAAVLEIGCGPLGGFVPALRAAGYAAVGVDPEAPDEPGYHRIEFEDYPIAEPVQAVVACTSLHHVDDLDRVLDRVRAALAADGVVVVVEWARERFDEATARWCFARLGATGSGDEPGWLHRRRDEWMASGLSWDEYVRSWADAEGLHTGERILHGLRARFEERACAVGPYFFADLASTRAADEQAAIDAGEIFATGIRYVGSRG